MRSSSSCPPAYPDPRRPPSVGRQRPRPTRWLAGRPSTRWGPVVFTLGLGLTSDMTGSCRRTVRCPLHGADSWCRAKGTYECHGYGCGACAHCYRYGGMCGPQARTGRSRCGHCRRLPVRRPPPDGRNRPLPKPPRRQRPARARPVCGGQTVRARTTTSSSRCSASAARPRSRSQARRDLSTGPQGTTDLATTVAAVPSSLSRSTVSWAPHMTECTMSRTPSGRRRAGALAQMRSIIPRPSGPVSQARSGPREGRAPRAGA